MNQNLNLHLKPLMISEQYVGNLSNAEMQVGTAGVEKTEGSNTTALIQIAGLLTPAVYEKISYLIEVGAGQADKIVLDINSPGGLVAGCLDLSDQIYKVRQSKPVYAVVNDSCYSAAYCLASAAGRVYLSRSDGLGSVGVIALHIDQSNLNAKIGLNITPIFAGQKKNDRSSHFPLSDRATKDLQAHIDECYDLFCRTVGRNRSMATSAVKQTEAGIYFGKAAVTVGFADVVCSRREAFLRIAADAGKPTTMATPKPKPKASTADLLVADAKARASQQQQAVPNPETKRPAAIQSTSFLH